MNLYKIEVEHSAPKSQHESMQCLLLAENDGQVYDWIASEPKVLGSMIINSWKEKDEEGDADNEDDDHDPPRFAIYNDNYEITGYETWRERMIRLRGELHDDDRDYDDLYYGKTYYGWELLKEDVTGDYTELIELGVVIVAAPKKE